MESPKEHWENVYEIKSPDEVSWTQAKPTLSLEMIASFQLSKNASIIDIGGGDSNLVDHLLDQGFTDLSVLDISSKAIERCKKRLGDKAQHVNWIVCDITHFEPQKKYDVWHDRATFHFLVNPIQIADYTRLVANFVNSHLIIATFSMDGPIKCSGLPISQYDESSLIKQFNPPFSLAKATNHNHITPFNTTQNFIYCSFNKH